MRSFNSTTSFPFTFSHTSEGIWKKYPNEHTPHVISVDTIERSVDTKTGILRTERVLGVKQPAPRWVVKFFGIPEETYVREVTFVVPSTSKEEPPKILMASANLSLSSIVKVKERISYMPSLDGHKTIFRQLALISAASKFQSDGWTRLGEKIEHWCHDRFASNAHVGKEALTSVLETLLESAKAPEPATLANAGRSAFS